MSEYVTSSVFEKQYLIICERKSSIHLYDLGMRRVDFENHYGFP